MSTASRRGAGTTVKPVSGQAGASPLWNAALVGAALAGATWLLVARGRLEWPPSELLASTYTVAGCLALVGPVVLARREGGEAGLGEWMWMAAGLLTWLYDLTAVLSGATRGHSWANPIGMGSLGLVVLAVLLAGWRLQPGAGVAGRVTWRWTNVVGWVLGLYWIGMSVYIRGPAGR